MREFRTKTAMGAFYKSMLGRYRHGERVGEEDTVDLLELLPRHPKAVAKIGVGVDHFVVRRTKGTQCFWIVRHDGTMTDFSYPKCVNGEPPIHTTVASAFRRVVSGDVRAARDALFAGAVETCHPE